MTPGQQLLSKLSELQDLEVFSSLQLKAEFFPEEAPAKMLEFFLHHVKTYGLLPSPNTIYEKGYYTPSPEPWAFYWDQVKDRYQRVLLVKGGQDIAKLAAQGNGSDAVTQLQGLHTEVRSTSLLTKKIDFASQGISKYDAYYKKVNQGQLVSYKTGFQVVDHMSGGMRGGDFISIVGRPGTGKTWLMLLIAKYLMDTGKKVLFVTMEMRDIEIIIRLISLYNGINPTEIENAQLDAQAKMTYDHWTKEDLPQVQGKLELVDGNLVATVDDIFGLAYNQSVDVLMVDGAYLVSNPDKRLNRYSRVGENVEDMKRRGAKMDIPVFGSFQFNREAKKQEKKKEDVGLEDIGYSDVIGQISSLVLGLFETVDESVKAYKERFINILKGRKGERGGFYMSWDFGNMKLKEVPPPEYVEAQKDDVGAKAGSSSKQKKGPLKNL